MISHYFSANDKRSGKAWFARGIATGETQEFSLSKRLFETGL